MTVASKGVVVVSLSRQVQEVHPGGGEAAGKLNGLFNLRLLQPQGAHLISIVKELRATLSAVP